MVRLTLTPLRELLTIFKSSINNKQSWRLVVLLLLVLPFSLLLLYWCHLTNSLTLSAFSYLTIFNIGSLVMCLISVWASKQKPNSKFSYGMERINVLTVFTTSILLILAGFAMIKNSLERLFEPPIVTTEHMLLATCLGLAVHVMVTCGATNEALMHAAEAATPNWLQNVLNDLGQSLNSFSPLLGRLLLYRFDPLALLVVGGALSVVIVNVLIDLDELYLADVAGALFSSSLICGTMLPFCIYTGKILLQTSPEHILPLLDKSLREASTLDGVLELQNEHFWTIAFGSYAGSLHVRVRRDADEQEVLTQLTSRLASQLNDLTIQVVKDEWTVPSSVSVSSPATRKQPPLSVPGGKVPRSSSPLSVPGAKVPRTGSPFTAGLVSGKSSPVVPITPTVPPSSPSPVPTHPQIYSLSQVV